MDWHSRSLGQWRDKHRSPKVRAKLREFKGAWLESSQGENLRWEFGECLMTCRGWRKKEKHDASQVTRGATRWVVIPRDREEKEAKVDGERWWVQVWTWHVMAVRCQVKVVGGQLGIRVWTEHSSLGWRQPPADTHGMSVRGGRGPSVDVEWEGPEIKPSRMLLYLILLKCHVGLGKYIQFFSLVPVR